MVSPMLPIRACGISLIVERDDYRIRAIREAFRALAAERDDDALQIGAVIESGRVDLLDRVREFDGGEARAASEGFLSDRFQREREGNRLQVLAVGERLLFDPFDGL